MAHHGGSLCSLHREGRSAHPSVPLLLGEAPAAPPIDGWGGTPGMLCGWTPLQSLSIHPAPGPPAVPIHATPRRCRRAVPMPMPAMACPYPPALQAPRVPTSTGVQSQVAEEVGAALSRPLQRETATVKTQGHKLESARGTCKGCHQKALQGPNAPQTAIQALGGLAGPNPAGPESTGHPRAEPGPTIGPLPPGPSAIAPSHSQCASPTPRRRTCKGSGPRIAPHPPTPAPFRHSEQR